MVTRTSPRHAAQKAKEAMAAAPETKRRGSVSTKRKGSVEKGPEPKKGKKNIEEMADTSGKENPEQAPEQKVEAGEKQAKAPPPEEKQQEKPPAKPEAKVEEQQQVKREEALEEKPTTAATNGAEAGMKTSREREEQIPSTILEKGIIYFFYRGRVNVREPQSIEDVARSFFVLRPTPLGAALEPEQGAADTGAKCRLLMLPKKKYPISGREREMSFVEKSGTSLKELQQNFIAGDSYETATRGTREVPEARPYAEGVYAITSTKKATHLVYHITLPEKLGEIQEDFGLSERGSWLLQSKNPKFPGPPYARLPQEPEFPERIQEKFKDYRWIPTEPELLEYPNAQLLMIGSAAGDLGKAAKVEPGEKKPEEEQPEEEVIKMEDENEDRLETLGGDHAIYKDLGYHAQEKYPKLATTWDAGQE
ncbi:uncharacterized protein BJX67DRAFT_157154 [Aspergillus lucknowensis]|uniref:BTB domain transcription factor n=1 Tax=Aspergillus lucknowensis TaxID=176173 RepID=A0ABR4LMS5_9EURO